MSNLWHDVRYALRMLVKHPGFTVMTILTLALGVGANTAIFSVIDGVMLRPLVYPDAERLMVLAEFAPDLSEEQEGTSPATFLDLRERTQSFEHLVAIEPWSFTLTGLGEPESFKGWTVTEGFFETMGVQPMLGRSFLPEEYQPGGSGAVVLGYGLWQRRFGGDPNIVGTSLHINGEQRVVAGVMPPKFRYPAGREIWAPRTPRERDSFIRGANHIRVLGRLKPGVSPEQATEEVRAVFADVLRENTELNAQTVMRVEPLPDFLVGEVRPSLLMLFGAVAFVLFIACANVANLLMVHGAERRREFAVRAALGASRSRLVGLLLIESTLIATLGGALGLLIAWWGVDLITSFGPSHIPRIDEIGISPYVLAFTTILSALTVLLFGLVPALQSSSPVLHESLKESGNTSTATPSQLTLRKALIVGEVAIAIVLLIGTGLLIRSFGKLMGVDPGFAADDVVALEVHVWGGARTEEHRRAYFDQAIEGISALPGVVSAGAVSALPFTGESAIEIDVTFTTEGEQPVPAEQRPITFITFATTDYFDTIGIPVLEGRSFSRFDTADSAQVVVVNETLARKFWPTESPVGKRVLIDYGREPVTREIVGVVGDVLHLGLDTTPRPEFFVPHSQHPYGSMTFVVRTAGDATAIVPAIKSAVWQLNDRQPFSSIALLDDLVDRSLEDRRFYLALLLVFAGIALALTGIGIYGVISYATAQRTHEIGIRMALGARANDILGLVLKQGLGVALVGLVIGLAGAFALTRLLESFLFGVSPADPGTYVAIALLLGAVALAASFVPARRATRVDPLVALREE